MKKILSLLMAFALVLGMHPGAALAASSSNQQSGFDATVNMVESNNGNTITVTIQSLPAGKTPTLSVPCGENWMQATVTHGNSQIQGVTIETIVEDGTTFKFVNFTVTEGGTYVITKAIPLPAGHQQLYFKYNANQAAMTTLEARAGDNYSLMLYTDQACTNAITETAEVSVSESALGTPNWNSDQSKWMLNTRSAIPGTNGYLTAKVGDTCYSLALKMGKATFGVYTVPTINQDAPGENYVPQVNEEYEINYIETGSTAYIIPGGSFEISAGEVTMNAEKVSATLNQSGILEVSVTNDFTGTVLGIVKITFGEKSMSYRLKFTDGEQQGGNQGGENPPQGNGPFELCNVRGGIIVPGAPGSYLVNFLTKEGATCYFRTTGDALFADGCGVTAHIEGTTIQNLATGTLSADKKTFAVSLGQVDSKEVGAAVTLKVEGGATYYANVFFRPIAAGGINTTLGATLYEERAVVESDYVEVGDILSEPFKVDFGNGPQDVYMAIDHFQGAPNEEPPSTVTKSAVIPQGVQEIIMLESREVGFFLKEGDGYMRIDNDESLERIRDAFVPGSLSWSIHVPKGAEDPATMLPKVQEFCRDWYSFWGAQLPIRLRNSGYVVLRLNATLKEGNKWIHSDFTYACLAKELRSFTPTSENVIGEINAYLKAESTIDSPKVIHEINVPSGEHTGYIEVPERFRNSVIYFEGSDMVHGRDNYLPNTTIITGGIKSDGFNVGVFNIDFIGAGRGKTAWPETEIPNQAIYGSGKVRAGACAFEGYHIALGTQGTENRKDANASLFVNNDIAVCVDTEVSENSFDFTQNEYKGNGIALYMKARAGGASSTNLASGSFIDNEIDVKNDLKDNIFMPGCFFGGTVNGVVTVRACNAKSPDPGGVGKKQVLVYPQAATQERVGGFDFAEFIYETSHAVYSGYGKKGPMISKNFAVTYPIPEGALAGSTFRIMDPDTLKVIKFTFPVLAEN